MDKIALGGSIYGSNFRVQGNLHAQSRYKHRLIKCQGHYASGKFNSLEFRGAP